jgi:hypothetical protein
LRHPYGGCVYTARGDNAVYALGESVTICYTVTQPMYVRIVVQRPDGSSSVALDAYDHGTGGCLAPLATGLPPGQRTVTMYAGLDAANAQVSGTTYSVQ